MRYRIKAAPRADEVEDLEDYVFEELGQVEQALAEPDGHRYTKLYVEPERPRDGDVVYADGTEWDPGSGEGFYAYYGAAWNKISATGDAAGVYTPTLTGVANVSASTAYACQYLRLDNVVTVSGKVNIDPTAATTLTQLGISLPVPSNIGATEQCGGAAASGSILAAGAISGDASNNRAQLDYISQGTAAHDMYFSFTYQVI
jgi:hypothetical protein